MTDESTVNLQDSRESAAYDRPTGQDVPEHKDRPGARVATKLLVTVSATLASAGLVLQILHDDRSLGAFGPEFVILSLFAILSALVPLQFAYKQEMTFDLLVVVLAALVLPTELAILACAGGQILGYGIRYRFKFGLDCPFNASILAFSQLATTLVFAVPGWERPTTKLGLATLVVAGALAALVWILITRFLVALVINLESRQSFRSVLRDSTLGMQSAEQAMLGAMIALGITGSLLARISPYAMLLLIVPAFALWLALKQNVDTRHRIEASLATAQRVAGIGSLDWDLRLGDVRWSEILYLILGYDQASDSPSVAAYLDRVHPEERDRVMAAFNAAADGRQIELDHRILLPDGTQRSFNLKFNAVQDRAGRTRRVVGTIHDVTERKQLEDRLQFQAYHDSLTSLPNRAFFLRKLESSFARYSRTSSIALLFLDLDRFKVINDTMGHDAGDALLRVVARRIEGEVRPNDVVARLGGDEFIILLDSVESDADVISVANRVIEAINQPVEIPGQRKIVISTSVGIVRPTPLHTSGDELLRDADTALYRAKENGRNRIAFFDSDMGAETGARLSLEADLRHAVERGEMSLVYQPRMNLTTGRVQMIESLVRWSHPTRGDVSPSRFIPIAEETGLIDSIGRWIVRTAIAEAKTWLSALNPAPTLSLNITRKQLLDTTFPEYLEQTVREAGLSTAQIRLEIAETALMADVDSAVEAVARLRLSGFAISIDDFGSGHSSLTSLRKFPIDMLQLDHQFVLEMSENEDAAAVTQAIIGLAHGLELTVLAEGVERKEQVEQLLSLGCELGQGTYFCAPLPAAGLLVFLLRTQQAPSRPGASGEPQNLRRLHK